MPNNKKPSDIEKGDPGEPGAQKPDMEVPKPDSGPEIPNTDPRRVDPPQPQKDVEKNPPDEHQIRVD